MRNRLLEFAFIFVECFLRFLTYFEMRMNENWFLFERKSQNELFHVFHFVQIDENPRQMTDAWRWTKFCCLLPCTFNIYIYLIHVARAMIVVIIIIVAMILLNALKSETVWFWLALWRQRCTLCANLSLSLSNVYPFGRPVHFDCSHSTS